MTRPSDVHPASDPADSTRTNNVLERTIAIIQRLAGAVATADTSSARQICMEFVAAIPDELSPGQFWIIRELSIHATERLAPLFLGEPAAWRKEIGHAAGAKELRESLREIAHASAMEAAVCEDVRVARALRIIARQYRDPELRVSAVALTLRLSRSRLEHLLKLHTQRTFSEHLRHARIWAAQRLLADRTLSIKEIADAVGINSVRHFNRQFHCVCKMSPSAWRAVNASAPTPPRSKVRV